MAPRRGERRLGSSPVHRRSCYPAVTSGIRQHGLDDVLEARFRGDSVEGGHQSEGAGAPGGPTSSLTSMYSRTR